MSAVALVFPHQLFLRHPALRIDRPVYLIEEELFFNQYRFHRKKLVLHRASMKYYQDLLLGMGMVVHYIEASEPRSATRQLIASLPEEVTELHVAEVTDDWLERRLRSAAAAKGLALIVHRTPCFLNSMAEVTPFFEARGHYRQTDFYIHQRRQRGLLLDERGQPLGGQWTYDSDNRLRFPRGHRAPGIPLPQNETYVPEALRYVETHYAGNPGDLLPPFQKTKGFFPVTHAEAEAWLDRFLIERFALFGPYEDAMVAGDGLLYHSLLSPLLNTGLLTPAQVLEKALDAASGNAVPLNSLEGFVRQIIGWREFVRILYEREGRLQRTRNHWGFTRALPSSFYTGDTGLPPVDILVRKVLQNGYAHHIERLMVLGNIMLLCEFNPDGVYRWFMEMFVDAYDWVMVPNTYGMTQFADGGLTMTKPYISSSNYLLKMGNWKKGSWQEIWDALFWRFLSVHRDYFSQNPRLALLLKTWDDMPLSRQHMIRVQAEAFLQGLD